ncbi:MAG TPA: peptidoglycan-associated lipoprotein Pal [Gemmatimonadaceae bacterium]|nr:peptidoglycan-associated lipoprotein Pal [Gemmatimonadaceae bacterium]
MNHVRRIAGLTTAMLSVLMVDACHKKPAPAPAPAIQPPNADSAARAQEEAARRAAADAARRRAADSAAAADAAARDAAAKAAGLRTTLTQLVHFEFDQSDLRAEDRAILDAKVPILQANSNVTIRISGHADERGSDEYNLALGQRRAAAVKQYLVQHGIADSRIETVSYGEERPIAQGSDEGAYAQNRRAEFEITAGPQTLRAP